MDRVRCCAAAIVLLITLAARSDAAIAAHTGNAGPQDKVAAAKELRVCSDPNNLPFSNDGDEGFENRIAELVARDLGRTLTYFWMPQRRGFVRSTLAAHRCDLIIGVPALSAAVRTTIPYYRSTYVFVTRRDRQRPVRSFDDPRLRQLRVGIQVIGDDYANPPPAQALAARHVIDNVRGYPVYGEYSHPSPTRGIIDAVAKGDVDVAVTWGPLAGYFARREPVHLDVMAVSPQEDGRSLRFVFDIAMGVRHDDSSLADALNRIIARRQAMIRHILTGFGVPLVAQAQK